VISTLEQINENHPLASLMELVSVLIEQYQNIYVPESTNI